MVQADGLENAVIKSLAQDSKHEHHGSPLNHPCAGPVLLGAVLVALAVALVTIVLSRLCKRVGVRRLRENGGLGPAEASIKFGHFWYPRLEAGGLAILTAADIPVFIAYARHSSAQSFWWILSSSLDIVGMLFICVAFMWEDHSREPLLGLLGSIMLVMSDVFAMVAASVIGLASLDSLGVVLLWFSSSLASAIAGVFLASSYFQFPCGPRLALYFEAACLMLFTYSGLLEISYGFCPAEPSSPNFFGQAGILNLIGFVMCFWALLAEHWDDTPLRLRAKFEPENESLLPVRPSVLRPSVNSILKRRNSR